MTRAWVFPAAFFLSLISQHATAADCTRDSLLRDARGLEDDGMLVEARQRYLLCQAPGDVSSCTAAVVGKDGPPALTNEEFSIVEACHDGVTRLEAAVPTVVFAFEGAPADTVPKVVHVDGTEHQVGPSVAVRLNPGRHVAVVGFEERKIEHAFELARGQQNVLETIDLRLPEPERQRDQASAPQPSAVPAANPVSVKSASDASVTTTGFVLGGVGLAGVVVGSVLGGIALTKNSDATTQCPDKRCPEPNASKAQAQVDEANSFGVGSTVALVIGGAALATGVVFLVVGADDDGERVGQLQLRAAPTSLSLSGAW